MNRIHMLMLSLAVLLGSNPARSAGDLNAASQSQLERITGIGPGLSERLVRERHDALFRDWEDLQRRVPGLGPVVAARLSVAGWTVAGAAYAATDSQLLAAQPKKRATSSRRDQASDSPSLINARVKGDSNSR